MAEKLIEATVARGTVYWGGEPWSNVDSGQADAAGRPIMRHVAGKPPKQSGPGETVLLPADEVARLRAIGALVDPAATPIPVGQGPTFSLDSTAA